MKFSRRKMFVLLSFSLLMWLSILAAQAQKNSDHYIFGSANLGDALFGTAGVTNFRIGYGHAWENLALEGQVQGQIFYTNPIWADADVAANGGLVIPSLSIKYIFGQKGNRVRFNLGAGIDYIAITGGLDIKADFFDTDIELFNEQGSSGVPWGHLMTGIDFALTDTTDLYLEARTYLFFTEGNMGLRYRF